MGAPPEPIAPSEATTGAPPDDVVIGWNPARHELSFDQYRSDLVPIGYTRTELHESTVAALEAKLARYEAVVCAAETIVARFMRVFSPLSESK